MPDHAKVTTWLVVGACLWQPNSMIFGSGGGRETCLRSLHLARLALQDK